MNIAIMFGAEILEWCGYPMVTKSLRIYLAVLTQYRRRLTCDTQTDGRTSYINVVSK